MKSSFKISKENIFYYNKLIYPYAENDELLEEIWVGQRNVYVSKIINI